MERKISVSMIKGIATMTCTVIGNELEMISPALILLLLLMITDYISGMLGIQERGGGASRTAKNYGWSS